MNRLAKSRFSTAFQYILASCFVLLIPFIVKLAKGDMKWISENWILYAVAISSVLCIAFIIYVASLLLRVLDFLLGRSRNVSSDDP